MAPAPKKPAKPAELPVLTERPDAGPPIPVLTEELASADFSTEARGPLPLSDAECQRLAAQLAPQLEAILRAKFAQHFDAWWEKSWREAESKLPGIIREQLGARPHRSPK